MEVDLKTLDLNDEFTPFFFEPKAMKFNIISKYTIVESIKNLLKTGKWKGRKEYHFTGTIKPSGIIESGDGMSTYSVSVTNITDYELIEK
jgi:hypothetical protein